jgi:hypothetical protein
MEQSMEQYKTTYDVRRKGRHWTLTRSVDRTPPDFLQGGCFQRNMSTSSGRRMYLDMMQVLLERAERTKKPFKLEVIYQISE